MRLVVPTGIGQRGRTAAILALPTLTQAGRLPFRGLNKQGYKCRRKCLHGPGCMRMCMHVCACVHSQQSLCPCVGMGCLQEACVCVCVCGVPGGWACVDDTASVSARAGVSLPGVSRSVMSHWPERSQWSMHTEPASTAHQGSFPAEAIRALPVRPWLHMCSCLDLCASGYTHNQHTMMVRAQGGVGHWW